MPKNRTPLSNSRRVITTYFEVPDTPAFFKEGCISGIHNLTIEVAGKSPVEFITANGAMLTNNIAIGNNYLEYQGKHSCFRFFNFRPMMYGLISASITA